MLPPIFLLIIFLSIAFALQKGDRISGQTQVSHAEVCHNHHI
jgi:hypothetical protein